jgi:hypothetical protein
MLEIQVFWDVAPRHIHLDFLTPENGGNRIILNVGSYFPVDIASYPRRPGISSADDVLF